MRCTRQLMFTTARLLVRAHISCVVLRRKYALSAQATGSCGAFSDKKKLRIWASGFDESLKDGGKRDRNFSTGMKQVTAVAAAVEVNVDTLLAVLATLATKPLKLHRTTGHSQGTVDRLNLQ